MNTKNNKRRKESVQRIEKTFVEMIQTTDIKDISVTGICKIAGINRSTFYAHYLDIYDLVDKMRDQMLEDFQKLYEEELTNNYNSNDFLKLFSHIKDNQLFYKTYFKLQFDRHLKITHYDIHLAQKYYDNQYIEYHCEFFKAGITVMIKMWLENDCDLSPEELFQVLKDEYNGKKYFE